MAHSSFVVIKDILRIADSNRNLSLDEMSHNLLNHKKFQVILNKPGVFAISHGQTVKDSSFRTYSF